ncbi:PAS domain-containing protein [Paenibacillus sp. TAB 01]|uniref:PAS domain-containing protein n=1 Tax=Paenibacillus sp. TAB 01 TaxID=3368988 RepID=UPI00375033E0
MKLFKFRSAKTAEQNGRPVSLSASPSSYQSLFDLNPDLVFSLDSEGRLVEANTAFTRILGYTSDDLNPEFMEQLMPADQFNQVKNYLHHTLNGAPQSFEAVVRHKQGHYVELSMTTIPHSENNQITGIYGIAKDITERRKLEQRYQSLFKNSINATFVLDVHGNVLDVNEAAIRMTGYARHEQISFTQFFSAEDLEATMKYHEKVTSRRVRFNRTPASAQGRSRHRCLMLDCPGHFSR